MLEKLKNKYVLAVIFGVLTIFGFAPFYFFVLSVAGIIGLFWLLDESCNTKKQYILCGFAYGFGYFLAGIYWIAISLTVDAKSFAWMIPFALTLIPSALALFFAGLAYGYYYLKTKFSFNLWQKILLFALLWVFFEVLRSVLFTGFPWNLIGYVFFFNINLVQIANIFGSFYLSLFFVVASLALFAAFKKDKIKADKIFILVVASLLMAQFGYGLIYIKNNSLKENGVNLRIVQANIKQEMKWDEYARFKNFEKHINLSKKSGFDDIDLVIWSESSLPYAINVDNAKLVEALTPAIPKNGNLVSGALRFEVENNQISKAFNSVALFDKNNLISFYDKHHLVPFGEYVPLQKYLPFIQKITHGAVGFSEGGGPKTLVANNFSFSPLICYEVIFLDKILDKNNVPDLLVNVTNDAWFGNSLGPYQHFDITRMRAVEYGISLIRAANTGISAYIDPFGRVVNKIALNEEGILDVVMISRLDKTIFLKYGHLFFGVFFLVLLLLLRTPTKT